MSTPLPQRSGHTREATRPLRSALPTAPSLPLRPAATSNARPAPLFRPSLGVLLWRIRGYLVVHDSQADVIAEGRGKVEDGQLRAAYEALRTVGGGAYGTAEEYRLAFPVAELRIREKDHNVAGLQMADLLVAGQKVDIAMRNNRPVENPPSVFTQRLNAAARHMINQYGRVWLD